MWVGISHIKQTCQSLVCSYMYTCTAHNEILPSPFKCILTHAKEICAIGMIKAMQAVFVRKYCTIYGTKSCSCHTTMTFQSKMTKTSIHFPVCGTKVGVSVCQKNLS